MVVNMRNVFVGICFCVAAGGASALSLGASRGTVVLGSTIDLAFEVRPDPDTDLSSSCITVHLTAGATPIADSRIRVTPMEGGQTPMVRVQAFVPVEEPVLTATVAAGCAGRVSRVYTFLADLPSAAPAQTQAPIDIARLGAASVPSRDAAAPGADVGGRAADRAAARPRQRPAAPRVAARRSEAGQAAARSARPPTAQAAPARKPRAADLPKPQPKKAAAAAPAAKPEAPAPRLVMEPLDLAGDAPPELRMTREQPQMSVRPADVQRAESEALWQTLDASAAGAQQFEERLRKLEADVQAQRQQVEAERAVAAELRQQLALAESRGFSAAVVYSLVGLLLLALAGIAWLLRRSRDQAIEAWRHSVALSSDPRDSWTRTEAPEAQDSWRDDDDGHELWEPAPAAAPQGAAQNLPGHPPQNLPRNPHQSTLQATLAATPQATAQAAAQAAAQAEVPRQPFASTVPMPEDAAAAGQPGARGGAQVQQLVSVDDMFDIQQQAEFFTSIGEHEQAIDVLRKCIAEQGAAAPLAYRELLHLYHVLGRTEDFKQLRDEVQERINVRIPEFAQLHQLGAGLDGYPEALAQIEAVWTTPEVLALIDSFLFRRGKESAVERFDVAAIDDLLLLQSIAQTTPAHLRGALPPRTRTTPMAAAPQPAPDGQHSAPAAGESGQAPGLDLNLDFDLEPMTDRPLDARQPPENMLDLDLTDLPPPRLTLDELPPIPVTPPPAAGAPVGFGADNEQMELRVELERADRKK